MTVSTVHLYNVLSLDWRRDVLSLCLKHLYSDQKAASLNPNTSCTGGPLVSSYPWIAKIMVFCCNYKSLWINVEYLNQYTLK